jgi:hypothetical protein
MLRLVCLFITTTMVAVFWGNLERRYSLLRHFCWRLVLITLQVGQRPVHWLTSLEAALLLVRLLLVLLLVVQPPQILLPPNLLPTPRLALLAQSQRLLVLLMLLPRLMPLPLLLPSRLKPPHLPHYLK